MLQTRNQLNDLIGSRLGCHQVCWHFPAQCPVRFVQPLLCGFLIAFKQIYRPINDADNPYQTFTLFRVKTCLHTAAKCGRRDTGHFSQVILGYSGPVSDPVRHLPVQAFIDLAQKRYAISIINPATCQRRCGLAGVEDKLNVFIASLHLVITLYPNGNARANINHQQAEGTFPDCDTQSVAIGIESHLVV